MRTLKDKGRWVVVVFQSTESFQDETFEIIPDFWIHNDGTQAIWPEFKSPRQIIKAIKNRQQPNFDNAEYWTWWKLQKILWDTGKKKKIFIIFLF